MAGRVKAPRTVSRVTFLSLLEFTGGGDARLREAAEVIADGARALAGSWSRSIPASITLDVGATEATIHATAGPARPAELRLAHPLFGDRKHWYGPPGRPFLSPAAETRSDEAMKKYAKKIDDWARKDGFR